MGTTEQTVTAVRESLAPVVAGLGLALYDVELHGTGKARTLRVTVEREGGVDLDAITDVTRAVSPVLDAEPSLSGSYLLEVSSPGLERSLRTATHFAGARDETVSVKFRTEGGTQRVHGVLVDSDDHRCVVEGDDGRHEIAYDDITQARTIFEWGPAPARGSRKPARAAAGSGGGAKKGARA
jgi:ribosome maturation factor RimP